MIFFNIGTGFTFTNTREIQDRDVGKQIFCLYNVVVKYSVLVLQFLEIDHPTLYECFVSPPSIPHLCGKVVLLLQCSGRIFTCLVSGPGSIHGRAHIVSLMWWQQCVDHAWPTFWCLLVPIKPFPAPRILERPVRFSVKLKSQVCSVAII
jgi:hypothetical protein